MPDEQHDQDTHAEKAADHAEQAAQEARAAAEEAMAATTGDGSADGGSDNFGSADGGSAGGRVEFDDDLKRAGDAASNPRETAGHVRRKAGEAVTYARREGRQKAGQLAEQAKQQVTSLVNERKGKLADEVDKFALAARDAAKRLEDEGDGNVASYVHKAADAVDDVRDYVAGRDPAEMARDLGDLARRRPAVVLGGFFLAGVALSRFLKASADRDASRSYAGAGGQGADLSGGFDNRPGGNTLNTAELEARQTGTAYAGPDHGYDYEFDAPPAADYQDHLPSPQDADLGPADVDRSAGVTTDVTSDVTTATTATTAGEGR